METQSINSTGISQKETRLLRPNKKGKKLHFYLLRTFTALPEAVPDSEHIESHTHNSWTETPLLLGTFQSTLNQQNRSENHKNLERPPLSKDLVPIIPAN